ncbi:MAG TPA: serine hydrolase [Candidatus Saccharimonadia bacterium]
MTHVVDGVRRGRLSAPAGAQTGPVVRVVQRPAAAPPAEYERPKPIKYSAVAARLPQGRLDGVRRPRPEILDLRSDQPAAVTTTSTAAATVLPVAPPKLQPVPPVAPAAPVTPPAQAAPHTTLDISPYRPAPAPLVDGLRPAWWSRLTAWRPGLIQWRRPMIGFTMVAVAFMAATLAVRTVAPPKATTAHAEQVAAATVSATPLAPATAATPQADALQHLLDQFAAQNAGMFSLYVKDLRTGQTASVAADRVMTSASLYKLFVAQRTLERVDLRQWQLGDAASDGTGRTIDGCLNLMVTVSDNDCGRALGGKLGWGAQNQALAVEGYHDSDLASPQKTSARDVATLFEKLYQGTLLSQRSTDQFMNLLKNQQVNNRLPQGLPAGTVIAHKTGDLDGYVHDAGIVYGPKTNYLVVMMSGSWSQPGNAAAQFSKLSAQLWNYFEQ